MLFLYEEKIVQGKFVCYLKIVLTISLLDQPQCWIEFREQWHWQFYMVLIALVLFVIPTIIITACYAVMIRTIWTKSTTQFPKENGTRTKERIG